MTLHTFTNEYNSGESCYRQFLQPHGTSLRDSHAIGQEETLGEFLAERLDELDPDQEDRELLLQVLGDFPGVAEVDRFLGSCEKLALRESPCEVVEQTSFGSTEFDSVEIIPPTLRELQDDLWGEDETFPKRDWKHEVADDATHQGYWEWVESMREQFPPSVLDGNCRHCGRIYENPVIQSGPCPSDDCPSSVIQLVAENGSLCAAWGDIHGQSHQKHFDGDNAVLICRYSAGDCDSVNWPNPNIAVLRGALYDARETGLIADVRSVLLPDGEEFFIDQPYWKAGDHVTWTDPDDGVCSRSGVLTTVTELGDFKFVVTMDDGWMAEVCESELRRATR